MIRNCTADSHLSPKTTEEYNQILADLPTNLGGEVCTTEGPEGIRSCLLKKQLRRRCMQFQVTSKEGASSADMHSGTEYWKGCIICNLGQSNVYSTCLHAIDA